MYIMLVAKSKFKNNNKNFIYMDLKQGKEFKFIQNKVIQERSHVDIEKLQTTSMPDITGFKEFFTSKIDVETDEQLTSLAQLQQEFNSTLEDYQTTYEQYMTDNIETNNSTTKYTGKAIKSSNESGYYYVNKYGFKRYFTPEAWEKRPDTCPVKPETSEDSMKAFAHLKTGYPMGVRENCGGENRNYVLENANEEMNKKLFLSSAGKVFDYDDKNQEYDGCPRSGALNAMSQDTYSTLVKGGVLSTTNTCDNVEERDSAVDKLIQYNETLMNIVEKMNNEITSMREKDEKVFQQTKEQEEILYEKLKQLNNDKINLTKMQDKIRQYEVQFDDNKLVVDSEYSMHLMYTLVALGLGIFTIRYLTS